MAGHWQYTCAAVPLALYLFMLAVWHGGRHPRVVSGAADFALLILGIGGLALFGPLGQVLVRTFFGRPTLPAWLALAAGMALAALLCSRRAGRRLVVYHVDPATFRRVLGETLDELPGHYHRTLHGLEDLSQRRGVSFDVSPRLRTATLEAFGHDPETFVHDLAVRLRRRFRDVDAIPSRVPWILLGASTVVLGIAMVNRLLEDPHAHDALRSLVERFWRGMRSR